MKESLLVSFCLVLLLASASAAVPVRTAEFGAVSLRDAQPESDTCVLSYYNICSGWVFYWSAYCYAMFPDVNPGIRYGTCFDLGDCPTNCRHVTDIWWACKRFTTRARVDAALYCADEYGCTIGPPLWAWYNVPVTFDSAWQHFLLPAPLELCPCEETGIGKVVFVLTDWDNECHLSPYSDHVPLNVAAGCMDWRCEGHSYVYRNLVTYCDLYGMPGPMWISGADYGCTISLFWPFVNRYREGVNGTRHDNAAGIVFVDGHAEIFRDPDNTINPPYDDSPFFLNYWDHLKRNSLWPQ